MSFELSVKVSPKSSRNAIEVDQGKVKVWVTAPPVDGQANVAVCKLLAKALGLSPSKVRLIRGESSREKLIHVDGLNLDEALIALHATKT